ncbi:MAG: hypothetical protein ABEJ25_00505, partial [Candidatus Bipolaricaulia bacterium]
MVYRQKTLSKVLTAILITTLLILAYPRQFRAKTVLEADLLKKYPDRTVAEGNVKLIRPDWRLETDYLELKGDRDSGGIKAKGKVSLSSEDFTVRAERLSGRLAEESSSKLTELTLIEATGKSGSVSFRGDELKLRIDGTEIDELTITGDAKLSFSESTSLSGTRVSLTKIKPGWKFEVTEQTKYEGEATTVRAEKLSGTITTEGKKAPRLSDLTGEGLRGQLELKGADSGKTRLQVRGNTASLQFGETSRLKGAEFTGSSFSTCEGCRCEGGCAYSVSADRTSLIENDFVLARSATLKSFGLPVGWSPLYFITLKDVGLPERPYFPRIGYSTGSGISVSGALPIFLDKNHFGNVVADYFSRDQGLGLGVDYYLGGNNLTGLGEIYGLYRVFGDNAFKLEGTLNSNLGSQIEASANVNINQGPIRGTNYDQTEWRFSLSGPGGKDTALGWKALVARNEKSDDDSELTHAIESIPEISLSRKGSGKNFPLNYELRTDLGYYREKKDEWEAARSGARGKLGGKVLMGTSPLDFLSLDLKGKGWVNPYYTGAGQSLETRVWGSVEPSLGVKGPGTLKLRFIHRDRFGKSPFDFDAVKRLDRLAVSYGGSEGGINQSLSFHYDFVPEDGFSKAKYGIGFSRNSLTQKFNLSYDISTTSLSSVKTDSTYSRKNYAVNFSSGYNFDSSSIAETKFGLKVSSGKNTAEIRVKSDPFETWVKEVSGKLSLEFPEDWSFSLEGEYDLQAGKLSDLSYSLYNELQNCLKVGITGGKSGFWFDVELV